MFRKKNTAASTASKSLNEIGSGSPRELPGSLDADKAFALNQNSLAVERTEFAKIRTDLALTNSRMAIDRTHLSYLRTIVTLIGSGATLYEALPLLGVNETFSTLLAGFLLLAAVYFIYKDASTCPKMRRQIINMEERANKLAKEMEDQTFRLDAETC